MNRMLWDPRWNLTLKQRISHTFFRIKTVTFSLLQTFFFSLYVSISLKKITKVPTEYVNVVSRSGLLLNKKEIDVFSLVSEWSLCHDLAAKGDFYLATTKRLEIMNKVYSHNKIGESYFPPVLSNQFFGPIGHHGFLGMHLAAQEFGLIPKSPRVALVSPELRNNKLVSIHQGNLHFVNYQHHAGWTELPNNWHCIEKPEIIRGYGEFIESYDLIDRVFTYRAVNKENPLFELDEEYLNQSYEALASFGLREDDWFVGIHIRDSGMEDDIRNQSLTSYLPAINEIIGMGGWVIRIGGVDMRPLPNIRGLIDLTTKTNARIDLHPFVLAKSRFFIGTCSGPSWIPSLFGVPTILTNMVAVGRTALKFSEHTFSLPKTFYRLDGARFSLSEVLNSSFGFGAMPLSYYSKKGILVHDNTPEELREAVLEMNWIISGDYNPIHSSLNAKVTDIRSQFPWTSKGDISNSFLQKNEDWFLH